MTITATIRNCARCGGTHWEMEFKPFTRHLRGKGLEDCFPIYTHWAMCPEINEPVIMFMSATDRPVAGDL